MATGRWESRAGGPREAEVSEQASLGGPEVWVPLRLGVQGGQIVDGFGPDETLAFHDGFVHAGHRELPLAVAWRRIATRYDRCAHTFFSSICIAASLAFYLNQ